MTAAVITLAAILAGAVGSLVWALVTRAQIDGDRVRLKYRLERATERAEVLAMANDQLKERHDAQLKTLRESAASCEAEFVAMVDGVAEAGDSGAVLAITERLIADVNRLLSEGGASPVRGEADPVPDTSEAGADEPDV